MDGACFHVALAMLQDVVHLCTHRMEVGSNKVLLHHGMPWVVEDVDDRYHKVTASASNRLGVGRVAHEVAVRVNHNGKSRLEGVHGCCHMDLAA